MDYSTFLYDLSPGLMETFCDVIDSGVDNLGWRGLAARIATSWTEVRRSERIEATGKSPTRELLWAWAQQNKTLGDLLQVLEDMGHYRGIQLLLAQETTNSFPNSEPSKVVENPSPPESTMPSLSNYVSPDPGRNTSNHPVSSKGHNHRLLITQSDVIEGTRNFHQDMKIMEGKFSVIYRGMKGNQPFAVKLFKQVQKASWKKLWDVFRKEMEIHHLNQHPNILELLGCHSDGHMYWLAYPYMPNGSLFHRLHDQDVAASLSWQERLDIVKGVARAVHHLHMAQPCAVICANITSSNILLDERLQPKLSDFGMACLRPHSVGQTGTVTLDTTTCGTLGYLPDEYIRDGKLSVKLDVFSLGMVIMETLTGRKVREETPKHTLLRDVLKGVTEASGSVDSCLQFLDPRAGPCPHSLSSTLFRLALDCTSTRPRERPIMENVLQVLSQLLPLPCPPEDQPHTLTEWVPGSPASAAQAGHDAGPRRWPSMPVENDELHSYAKVNCLSAAVQTPDAVGGPCECSQSEVTYLSSGQRSQPLSKEEAGGRAGRGADEAGQSVRSTEVVDLYSSWPVQCSCSADGNGVGCEDCQANGFTSCPKELPQGDLSFSSLCIVDNPSKERLRNKIDLYKKGYIRTEELLSISLTTQE
ncbi:interleukin-1 receptor-associated kinase 3 isoform X1 [Esox lucius]|uniref:Protein kinase domain-containing protein n=3 Tax=Esox lucius TaxID=8010 RepID=A0AAY5K7V0_ESOLU|nr:interleukin-1 receptor-associated kinase 3 isoform X1 [Esox lucius]